MHEKNYIISAILFLSFIVFTFLIKTVDVQSIGPDNSSVGFATINECIRKIMKYNFFCYIITDWLGIAAILTASFFAVLGLCQCILRKSLRKVDPDILLLGLFYLSVIGCYSFFENVIVNYRPVLMNGCLESSYPSSHTMVIVCVMGTAMIQFKYRIKNKVLLRVIETVSALIILITVTGRIMSGVHCFTDVVGGLLIALSLIFFYYSTCEHYFTDTLHVKDELSDQTV